MIGRNRTIEMLPGSHMNGGGQPWLMYLMLQVNSQFASAMEKKLNVKVNNSFVAYEVSMKIGACIVITSGFCVGRRSGIVSRRS